MLRFAFICDPQTDGLVLITVMDWSLFCEEWNAKEDKGISAEIVVLSSPAIKLSGSCDDMPISDEDLDHSTDEANDGLEARKLLIKTYPEVKSESILMVINP